MKTEDKNTIGKLIKGTAHRDAVHVAVAPCTAGEELEPGDHVGIDENGTAVNWKKRIGIVDPFLVEPVNKGERFWVFLYPGTALNLRHEWDHPDFRESGGPRAMAEGYGTSRVWLQIYADTHNLKLEDLLAGVEKYIKNGCDDPVLEDDFKEYEVPDEFWTHYHVVTGQIGKGNFWGCCI